MTPLRRAGHNPITATTGLLALVCVILLAPIGMVRAAADTLTAAAPAGSSAPDARPEGSSYWVMANSDLVAAGQIESSGREVERKVPTSEGTLYYYYYSFKVSQVIDGAAPSEQVIEVATVWSGGKGDPLFMKPGDKLILFLERPTKERPVWLVANRDNGVLELNPQRVASIKRFIADGPVTPFNERTHGDGLQQSKLDVRISGLTNAIAPVSKRLANGRTDVLELPIRIENCSTQTITASIAHEWFGGIWLPTDLGAAVRRVDEPNCRWHAELVYLSGELGIEIEPTIWEPGQSHAFVLRMNWPGTGSKGCWPLMDAKAAGKYTVRFSLVFKAGKMKEYAVSPAMQIEVREKSAEVPREAKPPSDWGEPVDGVSVQLRATRTAWGTNEAPTFTARVRNDGERRKGTVSIGQRYSKLEVDGVEYWYDPTYIPGLGSVAWTRKNGYTHPPEPEVVPLLPGTASKPIAVTLDGHWQTTTYKRLQILPDRHAVRYAMGWPHGDLGLHDVRNVGIFSNPAEIEVQEPTSGR
jgi:hypothetical protein